MAGLVDVVLAALLPAARAEDDVAVLAARLLPADPARLRDLRRSVAGWAEEAGLGPRTTGDLQLALGETVANAVEHAYGTGAGAGAVRVAAAAEDDAVAVTVTDAGTWRPVPADPGFRGRGLQIIRELADAVRLQPGPHGTTVGFRVPLYSAPEAAGGWAPDRPARPAEVRVIERGGGRCVEVAGDLDMDGVGAVREDLLREAGASGPVLLDLTGLGHLTSIGIGLLDELVRGTPGLDVVLPGGGPPAPLVTRREPEVATRERA
ncbi:ATP-binding protein [Geodermatophilus sp. URMC 64]